MNRLILTALLFSSIARAQLPIIPARTVEETRVPVFATFQPRTEEQTVEHPVVLANFRLHLEYRLPTAEARLAVRAHPSALVALPVGKAGGWRVLDLRYEQVVKKAASLVAEVDGKVVTDLPEIAKSKSAQLTEQVTFPDGIAGVPTHLAVIASGGAEIRGAWVQPLSDTPHAELITQWNEETMARDGSQAVVWQTAINPVVALELLATGAWTGVGVLGPEAFPAQPFLDLLVDHGSPWRSEERTPR